MTPVTYDPFQSVMRGDAPTTAAQGVYETLRKQILDFDLPPGAPLSRNALAMAFGVSLTPIREAMRELEQDGLVRIFPQSKTLVTRIDPKELFETQFLRVAVETEVVRRLSQTPKAEAIKRAQAIVKMQDSLVEDQDQRDLFNDLDRAFHRTLFSGVGMEALHRMLARRLGHLARCQRLDLPRKGKMTAIVAAHDAIVKALLKGHAAAAAEAMRAHLSDTITRLSALQAEHPAFFTEQR